MSGQLFLWGARTFLVVVALLLLAVLAWVFRAFTVTVAQEGLRARREGSWWAPFVPRPDGRYGPLADNRWWSVFRAPERRTTGALAWRWSAWTTTAVVLGLATVGAAVEVALLVVHGWS